jgi:hypothetical protein
MRYLCLIYGNEAIDAQMTPEESQQQMGEYFAFNTESTNAGVNLAGEALMPTAMATTIRVRDGQVQTMDGPFAETKEQLGGYYVIKAENLDEAVHWAAKIPGARTGSVEIRPLVDWD